MPNEAKPRDVPGMVLALAFIAVGAWVLMQSQDLSPLGSVFPRTIAVALIVFSLMLIVQNLRRPRASSAASESATTESTPRRLGLIGIMGAWALLLPILGFFVSSILGFAGLLAVAQYERWTIRLAAAYGATALAIVTAFYFLMRDVLLIPVPKGLFF